jgi:hypothetical protein
MNRTRNCGLLKLTQLNLLQMGKRPLWYPSLSFWNGQRSDKNRVT